MDLPVLNQLEKIYPSQDSGAQAISKLIKNQNIIEQGIKDAQLIQGPQGPIGQTGADGKTPFIGSNGNWWIGSMDTGIGANAAINVQELQQQINVLNDYKYSDGITTPNILPSGKWYMRSADNPTDDFYYIDCGISPVSGYTYQKAKYVFGGQLYERIQAGNTWQPWQQIATVDIGTKKYSNSEMFNGWCNGIEGDPEWSRSSVAYNGKILHIYLYNVKGGVAGTKIFDLPANFPYSWYSDGIVGINGHEVIVYAETVNSHLFMCFGN